MCNVKSFGEHCQAVGDMTLILESVIKRASLVSKHATILLQHPDNDDLKRRIRREWDEKWPKFSIAGHWMLPLGSL